MNHSMMQRAYGDTVEICITPTLFPRNYAMEVQQGIIITITKMAFAVTPFLDLFIYQFWFHPLM